MQAWQLVGNNLTGDSIGDLFVTFDNSANGVQLTWNTFRMMEHVTDNFIDPNDYAIFWRVTPNIDNTTQIVWTSVQAFGEPGWTIFVP